MLPFKFADNATATQELKTPSDAADNSQTPSNHKAGKGSSESNDPSSENTARLNSSTIESSPAENADNSNLSDSSKDVPDSETLDLQCDDCSRDCDTEVSRFKIKINQFLLVVTPRLFMSGQV